MSAQPIKIAILAIGGEGGGVLSDWIVELAEQHGYLAQATSVPGVAQRTGATIYYVELFPRADAEAAGLAPVLALMPMPGDVDIVLASELMEAARADGRVDAGALATIARGSAARWIAFDMAQIADEAGSVISAALFGALAGSGALPFARPAFEETIARGGVGVAASRRAFDAGFASALGREQAPASARAASVSDGSELAAPSAATASPQPSVSTPANASPPRDPDVAALVARVRTSFPVDAQAIVV